jgi:murein DD-endopeptidase MepM/ murein hydrolase activator NlpD
MDKQFFTILIFPGAHGKLRRIRLPFYTLHAVLALSAIGLVMVFGMVTSYARMLWKVSNYNRVRSEREALKTQYLNLEGRESLTKAKLDSLQALASEVALSYGFGDDHGLRFPQAVLNLATESNSTLDAGYRASLYAFNAMKAASAGPRLNNVSLGMLSGVARDPSLLPSIWPVRGPITAGFGERMDPFSGEGAFHPGVDIAAPVGTDVEAAGDGLILEAGRDAGYGKCILIDHGDGITTLYGHLSNVFVVVGEQVKRGEIIGTVGITGRTTGPHLHYEVRIHDTPVNPMKFLHG